jgi:hypothetical protein
VEKRHLKAGKRDGHYGNHQELETLEIDDAYLDVKKTKRNGQILLRVYHLIW